MAAEGIAGRQTVGQRLEAGHIGAGKADARHRIEQRARPQPVANSPNSRVPTR